MSAVADHVYYVASSGWKRCDGDEARPVPAWPRLTHSALVVLDVNDIYTDVWRFEGKLEYAAALIEKRVRTQGLVEGELHIVMHRLIKVSGGFQCYFSAIPLDLWQRCIAWAQGQPNHCLLMTACGLLCHGVANGKMRLLLSQRRLMYFAHTEDGMVFDATQALGADPAAMAKAAKALVGNQQAVLRRVGPGGVEWGTLWSVHPADSEICLETVQAAVGGAPSVLPANALKLEDGLVQTALPALAGKAAGRHALNPLGDRVAWHAENWVYYIAAVTLVVGASLVATGELLAQQADKQRVAALKLQTELQALQGRIATVATVASPDKLLAAADFSRNLDEGVRYDPIAFLADLKAASGSAVRIQRVQLNPARTDVRSFRVDGTVAPIASAALTHWVSEMVASGWMLKALDPTSANAGAFSYDLVSAGPAPKGMKR